MKDSIGYAGETPEWRADYDDAIDELDREFPAASAAAAIIAEKIRGDCSFQNGLAGHILVHPLPRKPERLTSIRKPTPPSNHTVG